MGNPLSWEIVSIRFLMLMKRFVPPVELEIFEAPLIEEKTGLPLMGFYVINVLLTLDVVAKPLETVSRIVLRQDRFRPDVHIFRLAGHETVILVSEEIVKAIKENKLQGIAFIPTTSNQ